MIENDNQLEVTIQQIETLYQGLKFVCKNIRGSGKYTLLFIQACGIISQISTLQDEIEEYLKE